MKPIEENPYNTHEQVSLLLPWYVNKTLLPDELKLVERHLGVCLLCKRELGQLRQLSSAIRQPCEWDSAAQASFSRFKKRFNERGMLDQAPAKTQPARALGFDHRQSPRTVRQHAVWALAAMILLLVLIPSLAPIHWPGDTVYRTLADSSPTHASSHQLGVIFQEQTSPEMRLQIISGIQGHIVGGPDSQSVYSVGFDTPLDFLQLNDKAAELRSIAEVVFAEPSHVTGAQPEQLRP